MEPIFTIHAGEYIVGEHIREQFKDLNAWLPAKDTGIDLLVTNPNNTKTVSLQVKMSRDYKQNKARDEFDHELLVGGWLTLSHKKLEESPADYWVIVVVSYERANNPQFIIIRPKELLSKLVATHGNKKSYAVYPWIMKSGVALNGRGLTEIGVRLLLMLPSSHVTDHGARYASLQHRGQ